MSRNPFAVLQRPPLSSTLSSLLVCLALAPIAARAQEPTSEPAEAVAPAEVPPSLPNKRTGWDIQGVPAINFNPDEGFGFGAVLMFVDRADGSYEPFRYSVLLQVFQTTRQVASHFVNVDAPQFLGSQWRMGVDLAYLRTKFAPWYGLGNTASYVTDLSQCSDRDALEANPDLCPGNADFRGLRYYAYDHRSLPRIRLNARRDLTDAFNLFLGYRLRMDRIRVRYSEDDLGQSGDSKLIEDSAANTFEAYEGRTFSEPFSERISELIAGIQYDTRDVEAAPSTGMFHELSLRGSANPIGSQFNYWGTTLHARFYHPVIPGYRRLVASWRGLFDVMGGEVPISLLPYYGGLENRDGLGGVYSARGILLRRYQGPAKLLLNGELRWTAFSIQPWKQDFDFTLVAFVDSGRVWKDLNFQEGGGLKTSAGGGLRIGWNREFVIRLDYGVGITESTSGFYLDIGHMF